MPRENPPVRRFATSVRPTLVEDFVDSAAVDAVGVGQPAQVAAGAAPGVDRTGFEQGTDVAQRDAQVPVAVSVDGDPPRRGGVEADHHAHRGGLAGAVRAEEAGDFPFADPEAEAVDSDGRSAALGEFVDLDHRDQAATSSKMAELTGANDSSLTAVRLNPQKVM